MLKLTEEIIKESQQPIATGAWFFSFQGMYEYNLEEKEAGKLSLISFSKILSLVLQLHQVTLNVALRQSALMDMHIIIEHTV